MNNAISAGLLMYKFDKEELKVFLVHPGGPYFKNKDDGYWSIPKGLVEKEEELLNTAIREFKEETGNRTHWRIQLSWLGETEKRKDNLCMVV
ncbi:MAG: NUDIX domain-containing protein [Ignavibacteriales bacterium]|nr:NUDIX domain-containing protein [Ignavibacteriales bacterium]